MDAARPQSAIVDALKRFAPLLLGGAAFASGAMVVELPSWAIDSLRQWGPAAALLLILIWYVPRSAIQDFISAQKEQAVALTSVAENIKALPQKDHMKFEELIIGQEMLNRSIDRLHDRLDDFTKGRDGKS